MQDPDDEEDDDVGGKLGDVTNGLAVRKKALRSEDPNFKSAEAER